MTTDRTPQTAAAPETDGRWPTVRKVVVAVYLVVLASYVVFIGVPLDRISLTLWAIAGLAAFTAGKGWKAFLQILRDWLPFTIVLLGYDVTRGLAGSYERYVQGATNSMGFPLHVVEPVHADEWLFGGTLPTVWLQEHLYTPGQAHWYDAVVTLVYITHFLATPVIAAVLWFRNRPRFRAWVACVIALALAGVATYIVYPMAPPWLAAQEGVIPPIARISGLGYEYLGLGRTSVFSFGRSLANPVAAMPSLHTAYSTLVAGFFMVGAPWWRKLLLACYPLLMGAALVYSGEHYVIDLVFGILYAAVVLVVWRLLRRRRARRATDKERTEKDRTEKERGSQGTAQDGAGTPAPAEPVPSDRGVT